MHWPLTRIDDPKHVVHWCTIDYLFSKLTATATGLQDIRNQDIIRISPKSGITLYMGDASKNRFRPKISQLGLASYTGVCPSCNIVSQPDVYYPRFQDSTFVITCLGKSDDLGLIPKIYYF